LDLGYLAIKEAEETEVLRSVAMADTAIYVDSYGERTRRRVLMRFDGQPRSTTATEEYKRALAFYRAAWGPGLTFRYYPDTAVTLAARTLAVPWGYETYVCEGPSVFAPSLTVPDWYQYWQWEATWL